MKRASLTRPSIIFTAPSKRPFTSTVAFAIGECLQRKSAPGITRRAFIFYSRSIGERSRPACRFRRLAETLGRDISGSESEYESSWRRGRRNQVAAATALQTLRTPQRDVPTTQKRFAKDATYCFR